MYAKIIVIEPSYVLRKGIVSLLKEHFKEIAIVEEESDSIVPILSSRSKEVLFLVSMRLYFRNKELLEKQDERIVFLTYKNMEIPHINYLKTNEEEFVATIEAALDINNIEQKDEGEVLTESERNVLKHIASGLSNKEIANKLFISIHTVTTHRKNITRKLDIKSVSGLTVYAILHKLVSINDIQG